MTRRRGFVRLAIAWAVSAGTSPFGLAQPAAKIPRVGLVHPSVPLAEMVGPDPFESNLRAFVHRLRDLGYVDGRNIVIERRSGEGQLDRLPGLMKELVELRVDAIVAIGNAAQDAQRATSTIPIVAWVDDPVASGHTSDLGRPTHNVTGISGTASAAIHGKRLQLLKQAAPKSSRVAAIDFKYVDSTVTPGTHRRRRASEVAARDLGMSVIAIGVDNAEDFDQAFALIERERADSIIDMGTPNNFAQRMRIIDFAARKQLPAIYARRECVEDGGLMSYAPSELPGSRIAIYLAKILKGAKPSDLPFEQPTTFALVINSTTARRLGLVIPQPLLLTAEVIS